MFYANILPEELGIRVDVITIFDRLKYSQMSTNLFASLGGGGEGGERGPRRVTGNNNLMIWKTKTKFRQDDI